MLYDKYSTQGGVNWQIQHEAKLSAVFATQPHSSCYILSYNTCNGLLTSTYSCVLSLICTAYINSSKVIPTWCILVK